MERFALGLAEIVLWTTDPQRCLEFYQDLLGLEEMHGPDDIAPRFLKVADGPEGVPQMIVLVPHPDPGEGFPREKPRRVLHHLAFVVAEARYGELRRRFEEEGIEVREGRHPVLEGVETFYVDDPEGNEVEIISRRAG